MSKPIIILIVDDDPEDQQILVEYLHKQNKNIVFNRAGNGKEAVEFLDKNKMLTSDLMIFDYKMPLMGAIDILKYFDEKKSFKLIPKVVWSTSHQISHQQTCIENGAIAYFVKPSSPGGLTILAKNLLKLIN